MNTILRIVVFSLLLAVLPRMSNAAEACGRSFSDVVERHLAAVKTRDLVTYMQTLAPRDDQLMILPNGARLRSTSAIESMHREWFADSTWQFNTREVRRDVRDHWGIVVYEVSVDRPNKPGDPFLLSMLFAPESDGCWYLQHDQNTLLPTE
ncbi:hypothetical protein GCM10008090_08190 [Arenicella chitinivorans]|uniref:Nuclear transport factor 2 family protein n=1 Tax=Arenicella chitinivorans TaxID=1329800 RepID=A0A918RMZ4_9GAMM|nr:DUF4440 domain-containing protein [Arenicella chitinivorans]GHA01412.1 hypothetical protein GCM10008090_08190 [Arenicella chitinivorans]